MSVKHLTNANFKDEIKSGKALVDFWATWCGPCKMLAPTIEEISEELKNDVVAKVDVDKEPDLAREFGVMSIPTVILFKNGKEVKRFVGVQQKNSYIDAINSL